MSLSKFDYTVNKNLHEFCKPYNGSSIVHSAHKIRMAVSSLVRRNMQDTQNSVLAQIIYNCLRNKKPQAACTNVKLLFVILFLSKSHGDGMILGYICKGIRRYGTLRLPVHQYFLYLISRLRRYGK